MKADLGGQARIGQRARRHHRIVDLDVVRQRARAEADRVHRNVAAAQRGDRVEIDAAGIVGAVAQQHDRADRQIGGFPGQLLQAVADVRGRGGRRRFQIFQFGNARQLPVEPVDANLKFLLQLVEHAAFQRLDRLRFPRRAAVVGDGHAARIVHQHGDDVLLRPQLRHQDRRLPQQEQNQRRQRKLQQPDDARPPVLHLRGRFRQFRTNQPAEPGARRQHK